MKIFGHTFAVDGRNIGNTYEIVIPELDTAPLTKEKAYPMTAVGGDAALFRFDGFPDDGTYGSYYVKLPKNAFVTVQTVPAEFDAGNGDMTNYASVKFFTDNAGTWVGHTIETPFGGGEIIATVQTGDEETYAEVSIQRSSGQQFVFVVDTQETLPKPIAVLMDGDSIDVTLRTEKDEELSTEEMDKNFALLKGMIEGFKAEGILDVGSGEVGGGMVKRFAVSTSLFIRFAQKVFDFNQAKGAVTKAFVVKVNTKNDLAGIDQEKLHNIEGFPVYVADEKKLTTFSSDDGKWYDAMGNLYYDPSAN